MKMFAIMNKLEFISVFVILFCNVTSAQDFLNDKGDIFVKINNSPDSANVLCVKTKVNRAAYSMELLGDSDKITVTFFDLNRDGYDDIFVEFSDEVGFTPMVLVNIQGQRFHEALQVGAYSVEYANLDIHVNSPPIMPYIFLDINKDGIYEIVFRHIYYENRMLNNVTFYLDDTQTYVIQTKEH